MPISDIMGLDVAVQNMLDEGMENVLERHKKIASATRKAIKEYGLELYLDNGYSNTVTAVKIPKEIGALKLKEHLLKKYNTVITTSLEHYSNELIRIGHMGENAVLEKTLYILNVIDKGLKDLGFYSDKDLVLLFNKYL